jgi:ABC-type multidrug transport system ATPase subunit
MKRLSVLVMLTVILAGCTDGGTYEIKSAEDTESEREELLTILESEERLTDAVAYIIDGELVAAGKVKPFSKFNKAKIESKLQKEIKQAFPEHEVIFSTDLKIFWEIEELKEDESEKKMRNRLKEIQSLSKEET